MKYQAKVTEIGGMVQELAEDGNLLIIFNEDVQDPDLKDISIAHTVTELKEDIVAGDVLTIAEVQRRSARFRPMNSTILILRTAEVTSMQRSL